MASILLANSAPGIGVGKGVQGMQTITPSKCAKSASFLSFRPTCMQQQSTDCLAAVFSVISKSCNFVTFGQITEYNNRPQDNRDHSALCVKVSVPSRLFPERTGERRYRRERRRKKEERRENPQ